MMCLGCMRWGFADWGLFIGKNTKYDVKDERKLRSFEGACVRWCRLRLLDFLARWMGGDCTDSPCCQPMHRVE